MVIQDDQFQKLADRLAAAVLQRLDRVLPRSTPTVRLSACERDAITRLLNAAWNACGVRPFCVCALIAKSQETDPPRPYLASVLFCMSAKAIGKHLARAASAGIPFAGVTVHRVGDSRDGAVWRFGFVPPPDVTFLPVNRTRKVAAPVDR